MRRRRGGGFDRFFVVFARRRELFFFSHRGHRVALPQKPHAEGKIKGKPTMLNIGEMFHSSILQKLQYWPRPN